MIPNPLRVVSTKRLARVRFVLHHAAQLLVPPPTEANLYWATQDRVLWGPMIHGVARGLRIGAVQLLMRESDCATTSWFKLGRQTLAAARSWLRTSERTDGRSLAHHAVLSGGRFPGASEATRQLENEFHGAAKLLAALRSSESPDVTVSAESLAMTVELACADATLGFSPGETPDSAPFWFIRRRGLLGTETRVGPREVGPLDAALAPAAEEVVRRFVVESLRSAPSNGQVL